MFTTADPSSSESSSKTPSFAISAGLNDLVLVRKPNSREPRRAVIEYRAKSEYTYVEICSRVAPSRIDKGMVWRPYHSVFEAGVDLAQECRQADNGQSRGALDRGRVEKPWFAKSGSCSKCPF